MHRTSRAARAGRTCSARCRHTSCRGARRARCSARSAGSVHCTTPTCSARTAAEDATSPRNWSDMAFSSVKERCPQRDAEAKGEMRCEICACEPPEFHGAGTERHVAAFGVAAAVGGEIVARRRHLGAGRIDDVHEVRVRRHLRGGQRMAFLSASLAERTRGAPRALAEMDRRARAQVGQGERGLPVAAVRRAQQREERLVLVDRQHLPVAERPSLRREVEGDDADFGKIGRRHVQFCEGKMP